ncbi:MAG: hypothetical protein AAF717_12550 [Bacteroidota bacterium]
MKMKSKVLFVALGLFLMACNNDDDGGGSNTQASISSVSDATTTEGASITHTVALSNAGGGNFVASLSNGSTSNTDFDTDLANATLNEGVTYDAATSELNVPSGVNSFTVGITTTSDAEDENDETYTLTIGGESGTGTITDDDLPSAYIVQNTVQTPEGGRTVFVSVLSSLTDEVRLDDAFEFNGSARARTFNGKVYVFDSEELLVIRYAVNDDNTLQEEDRFSMAQLGAAGFNSQIAFVNDQYALTLPNGLRQFVVWNPTTMEVRGTIDFPPSIPDPFNTSNIGSINVNENGEVFIGIAGVNLGSGTNVPGARVAIVDPVSGTVDVVFDETIASGTEGSFDGEGNYYFSANAYFGIARYLSFPPDVAQTITRINQGERVFDPNFNVSSTLVGGEGLPASVTIKINGDEFLYLMIDATEEELTQNPLFLVQGPSVKVFLGDVSDWEGAVEVPFSDTTKSISDIFVVEDSFYAVARNFIDSSADSASDVFRITSSGTLEKMTEGIGWIEYIARVR